MRLLFATHNDHKTDEVRQMFRGTGVEVLSLCDLSDREEIPEDGNTIEQNALIKARTAYRRHGLPCFADDTGLEVSALGGLPGVRSARYAGDGHDSRANTAKLLHELSEVTDRSARFLTVVAYIDADGSEHLFKGVVEGEIVETPGGRGGFGYDPVFLPSGYEQTFAEMPPSLKNSISHRARAIEQLLLFLTGQPRNP